jgi:hypothetical protein
VPHARAWAEPIPRDNVEPAPRAAHTMPFGDTIQDGKDVRAVFFDAEALRLDVRAFNRPHLGVCFVHRLQRSELDRRERWFLASHLDNPRLSVPLPPEVFFHHWVTIADNRLAISISRSCAACW